jgi:hypothetical protein
MYKSIICHWQAVRALDPNQRTQAGLADGELFSNLVAIYGWCPTSRFLSAVRLIETDGGPCKSVCAEKPPWFFSECGAPSTRVAAEKREGFSAAGGRVIELIEILEW